MAIANDLWNLHSSLSLLVDSCIEDPKYRCYVPSLNQAEYLSDSALVTYYERAYGTTKANRTISQIFP
jgi:hypothetical protein